MQKAPNEKPYHSHQAKFNILKKHKLIADLVHKQDMRHHDLVETLVRKENMAQLRQTLNNLPTAEIAHILKELPPEDQLLLSEQLDNNHKQHILRDAPNAVLQILEKKATKPKNPGSRPLIYRKAVCTGFRSRSTKTCLRPSLFGSICLRRRLKTENGSAIFMG
jgi:hypothetical protein